MTALVIKNLPDDVLVRLRERAKANQRSLTKEAIVLLSRGVAQVAPLPAHEPAEAAYMQPGGPLTSGEIEDATRLDEDAPRATPDGREALRAALLKQPDGSYVNLLGIDDASFFDTLDKIRSEFGLPEPPDFGNGQR